MAAANASPPHRLSRASNDGRHDRRAAVQGTILVPNSESGYQEPSGIAPRYQQIQSQHIMSSSNRKDTFSDNNKLTARALPSEEGYRDPDLEIQHLRTQARSVTLLQELLGDARTDITALLDVVSEQETVLQQNGLQVAPRVEDKLARLRLGCSSIAETEWSVELKRPPHISSSGLTERDGRDQLSDSTKRIKSLERALRDKDEEILNLHHLLQASEDEKGREIARLSERLRNSCQDRETSDVICQSLSNETEVLKMKIQRLMEECQGLTTELANWKGKRTQDKNQADMNIPMPVIGEDDQQQIIALQNEISKLEAKLLDVVRMNKRWQKYNKQQEEVKVGLTQTIKDLEEQIKFLEHQCQEYEDSLSHAQHRLKKAEEERRHQRIHETTIADREASCRRLERRVAELEKELGREREKGERGGANYDGEVVKQQLKQFRDDFQKEHDDRKKLERENLILTRDNREAEALVQELDKKVTELETENLELKTKLRLANRTFISPELRYQRERRELTPHGASQNSFISMSDFPSLPQDVHPDGPTQFNNAPSSAPPSFSPRANSYPSKSVLNNQNLISTYPNHDLNSASPTLNSNLMPNDRNVDPAPNHFSSSAFPSALTTSSTLHNGQRVSPTPFAGPNSPHQTVSPPKSPPQMLSPPTSPTLQPVANSAALIPQSHFPQAPNSRISPLNASASAITYPPALQTYNVQSMNSTMATPPTKYTNLPRGEDFPDGALLSESSNQKILNDLLTYSQDEPLQCPRCLREFPVSKDTDFMRHMESCLDT